MRGISSMTGFGRSTRETADEAFEVEVRTVNNRSLKVQPRISESAGALAAHVEHHVREKISRGTIYVTVRHRRRGGSAAFRLDEALLRTYTKKLMALGKEFGEGAADFDVAQVALLPGVVTAEDALEGDLESFWERLRAPLDEAIERLGAMRREEGQGIARTLAAICDRISALTDAVEGRVEGAVLDYRNKLRSRIEKLLSGTGIPTPEADLARELALFADRSDISEELQRLRSHVAQLRSTLGSQDGEPVGRKLEFLAQELLREANTMAAKSHDTSLVASVLEIKLEVEKIREQVANVE
ncbi:YicC family protein [bacterium]|nr:YicC family protein [bacterium]